MFDLVKSYARTVLEKQVATGQTVTKEGLVLVSVLDSGIEKVRLSQGNSTERPVGFSTSDNQTIDSLPKAETKVVPASPGPYTVTLAKAPMGAFGSSTVSVQASNGSLLTEVASGPATGEFSVNYTTGVITFNSAQAGLTYLIGYRAALTVAEARQLFYQRNINNTAGAIFNQVGLMTGEGEMYTYEYDTAANWSGTSDRQVRTAANGLITIGGSNAIVGLLIKSPTSDDASVGVKFNLI